MIRCRKKRRFDGLEQFIYLPFADVSYGTNSVWPSGRFPLCPENRSLRRWQRLGIPVGQGRRIVDGEMV
jgi:hypothetical protein